MLSNLSKHSEYKSKEINNLAAGLTTSQIKVRQSHLKNSGSDDSEIEKIIS